MALDDVILTRTAYRDELRKALVSVAESSFVEADPSWDGVPALTRPLFDQAVAAVFDLPVPLPSEHAEVKTPAHVLVAAICPRCDLPTTILVTIHPELVVDEAGAEIRIKTKTKARSHRCGQQELPLEGASSSGETGLEQIPIPFGEPPISAEELLDLLSLVREQFEGDAMPSLEEIGGWTEPIREQVKAWATAIYNLPEGSDEPALPRVLGGEVDPPGVAADESTDDDQEGDADDGDAEGEPTK